MVSSEFRNYLLNHPCNIGKECDEETSKKYRRIVANDGVLPDNIVYVQARDKFYDVGNGSDVVLQQMFIELTRLNGRLDEQSEQARYLEDELIEANKKLKTIKSELTFFVVLTLIALFPAMFVLIGSVFRQLS